MQSPIFPHGIKNLVCILLGLLTCFALQANNDKPKLTPKQLLEKNLKFTSLNRTELNTSFITDAYSNNASGTFLVYLQQGYKGVPVYNRLNVYIFKNDSLIGKKESFIKKVQFKVGSQSGFSISPEQSIRAAANGLGMLSQSEPVLLDKTDSVKKYKFSEAGLSAENISVGLVWYPTHTDSILTLCWNVRIAPNHSDDLWCVWVNARTGIVVDKTNLTVYCTFGKSNPTQSDDHIKTPRFFSPLSTILFQAKKNILSPPSVSDANYRVYALPLESPNFGLRTLENKPWLNAGSGNNAVTLGWHFDNTFNYNITRGNNVWAQEDLAGTGTTTGAADTSSTAFPALTFDKAINSSLSPSSDPNLSAAIGNLFYTNNIMHDITYQYGFNEAAGNFQAHNLGRGGNENDFVNAFAQSGSGINNANFSTQEDGVNPRMRMYLFTSLSAVSFNVNSPVNISGAYQALESDLSPNNKLLYLGPITGNIVMVNDGMGGTHLGCSANPIANGAALLNNIAVISRGICGYTEKIKNAQDSGAIAVIVINNVAGPPLRMGGFDNSITIPAIMISLTDGNRIANELLSGPVSVTMSATGGTLFDGDFDNGIIAHEYTHGISNRLTGGPANFTCLTNVEQMGEGWSDYFALMVTTNWATAQITDGAGKRSLGTYVLDQPANGNGIRHYTYSTNLSNNPLTYDSLNAGFSSNAEPHNVGEIWCATLWDMTWNIIQAEGIDPDIYNGTKGNNIALQLVTEGMKFQPCSPGFLDGRDAILKADSILYNYAHKCDIWNAFARRGMGKTAHQGSSNSFTDQVTATNLPDGLTISHSVDKDTVILGDNITYTTKAYCDCVPLTNIDITDTLSPRVTYVSSSGGVYTNPVVNFNGIDFAAGEVKTFTIHATVTSPATASVALINDSQDPGNYSWTAIANIGPANWVQSTTRSHSASHSYFGVDDSVATDFNLRSGDLLLDTISTLSFWHYFETESTFDGGVVEITTNGGTSWQDLGPYMVRNPYNNTMSPFATNIGNRPAFSGSSGGFIQTAIVLSGFAGQTARIRFRTASDNNTSIEGWYIDDILVKNDHGINNIAYAYSSGTALSNGRALSVYANAALPVDFLLFEATKQENVALLHWKVAREINNRKYVVERSDDGIDFIPIGEVAVSLSNAYTKDYHFIDHEPLAKRNFYRVVQYDLDGKSTRSVIKSLDFNDIKFALKVTPVPTTDNFINVEIKGSDGLYFEAQLYDNTGKRVARYTLKPANNIVNLQALAKGIYFLKVFTGHKTMGVRKIIIQ